MSEDKLQALNARIQQLVTENAELKMEVDCEERRFCELSDQFYDVCKRKERLEVALREMAGAVKEAFYTTSNIPPMILDHGTIAVPHHKYEDMAHRINEIITTELGEEE